MRVSPAITRADSIFQTASMTRCVSVVVTITDHIMFNGRVQDALDVILSGGEAGARDRTTAETTNAADYTTPPAAQPIPPTASLRPAIVRSLTRLSAGFRMTSPECALPDYA